MSDIATLIPLEQVVKSFINATGEKDLSNYKRYYQIVIEAYTDIYKELPCYDLVYRTEVGTNNVIDLPSDCVDIRRIGIVTNGRVVDLFENGDIAIPETYSGVPKVEDPNYVKPIKYDFTQGGTYPMNFRRNMLRREVYLQGDYMGKEVYIEYIGTGIKANDVTYIDRRLRGLIEALLQWRLEKVANGRTAKAIRFEDEINHYVKKEIIRCLPNVQDISDIVNEYGTLI